MRMKAIVADIAQFPMDVDNRHKKGVNVLYGDGHGQWVDRTVFNTNLSSIPNNTWNPVNDPYILSVDAAGNTRGIWGDWDRDVR